MRFHFLVVAGVLACAPAAAHDIPSPLDRDSAIALIVERNPTARGSRDLASATNRRADGEGKLPSPELDLEVWQIPFGDRQGMLMAGLRQRFPALGLSLAAREAAVRAESQAQRAEASDVERELRRRGAHAFADYFEAAERVRLHAAHVDLANRILDAARARAVAGGSLTDAAQAEVEVATIVVEHEEARVKKDGARARINALLGRVVSDPLSEPVVPAPAIPAWTLDRIQTEATERHPRVALEHARADVDLAKSRVAKREWIWPTVSVAALYFAPVGPTRESGAGISIAIDLPWLWGERKVRADAAVMEYEASRLFVDGARIEVSSDVASAWRDAMSSALRVRSYDERVLPASRRAFDLAFAAYAANRSDLPTLLLASRSIVEAEIARLVAIAGLEHALADLDAAAGSVLPRKDLTQWSIP